MPYNIAVTSTDGSCVDLHFGQAEDFYIFEADEKTGGFKTLGKKNVHSAFTGCPVSCAEHCGGTRHENMMAKIKTVTALLAGCTYLLTAKIGPKPSDLLRHEGITALESPPDIGEAVLRLNKYHLKYGNINKED
jgi:predicted Fe-Mo cluster-binding NifX family protein